MAVGRSVGECFARWPKYIATYCRISETNRSDKWAQKKVIFVGENAGVLLSGGGI